MLPVGCRRRSELAKGGVCVGRSAQHLGSGTWEGNSSGVGVEGQLLFFERAVPRDPRRPRGKEAVRTEFQITQQARVA